MSTTTPEGRVKKRIDAVLKKFPRVFYDKPVPFGFGRSVLDYVGCSAGRAFMIEAKTEGKHPTALQSEIIRRFTEAGGRVFVVEGEDSVELLHLDVWLSIAERHEGAEAARGHRGIREGES